MWGSLIYTAAPWYTVHFKTSTQVLPCLSSFNVSQLILKRDQAYTLSYRCLYSGTRTVEMHSVAHADPAYRRSNAGQRLQHTPPYNPHRCVSLCATERVKRRKSVKESSSIFLCACQHQWSGCFVTVIAEHRKCTTMWPVTVEFLQ